VGIIPKLRDGEWEKLGGHILELLSVNACTNSGIAKRQFLLVLFFLKEKYIIIKFRNLIK
jgi:hypothetical protein